MFIFRCLSSSHCWQWPSSTRWKPSSQIVQIAAWALTSSLLSSVRGGGIFETEWFLQRRRLPEQSLREHFSTQFKCIHQTSLWSLSLHLVPPALSYSHLPHLITGSSTGFGLPASKLPSIFLHFSTFLAVTLIFYRPLDYKGRVAA